MGGEICTDNRFEIIAAYKKKLIEGTNIESRPDEMAVIDNILFRFWQMGWLPPIPHGRLIDADALNYTMLYKENWMRGTGVEALAVWGKDIDAAPTVIPTSEESE